MESLRRWQDENYEAIDSGEDKGVVVKMMEPVEDLMLIVAVMMMMMMMVKIRIRVRMTVPVDDSDAEN